jgi:pSer/pThr/pTyr-binding forkhead associated (FHA) protein
VQCTHCGQSNPADARYCMRCGRALNGDPTLTLSPVETEDEPQDEFPFPNDELERGQALLLVKRGPNAGSTFLLETDSTAIGRDPGSQVFLDDVTVSRKHAFVERRSGSWFVKDAGSLNGTYVNGEQADETALADHDEIQVGLFKLVFFSAGE